MQRIVKAARIAYKKARDLDCDVYHLYDPKLLPYGLKLKKAGKEVVFDSHEDVPEQIMSKDWIPGLVRGLVAFLYRRYETTVVCRIGAVVSVYYAATIFGKVVSLAITPINAVALTYLSKVKKKSNNLFKTAFLAGVVTCALGYVGGVIISRPVLTILYPQFVDQAMQYIYLTTGTTVLFALISIVNPFILKFFDMKWQLAINGGTALLYVALCMSLLHFWGLMGFCVGALITNVFKLVFMLFIYYRCSVKENL